MNCESYLRDAEPATDFTDGRRVRFSAAARRIAGVTAALTIVASFVEAAVNPAASFSALHFWLALFVAAATRDDESSESCRS
jgi:hypothetical protein